MYKRQEFTCRRPFVYYAVNPHPFEKCDVVYLPTDFWEDEKFFGRGFRVEDEEGNILPSQRTYTLRGSMIACRIRMKPNKRKTLRLVFSPDIPQKNTIVNRMIEKQGTFENESYQVQYLSLIHI